MMKTRKRVQKSMIEFESIEKGVKKTKEILKNSKKLN